MHNQLKDNVRPQAEAINLLDVSWVLAGYVVEELLRNGYRVRTLERNAGSQQNDSPAPHNTRDGAPAVERVFGDVTRRQTLPEPCQGGGLCHLLHQSSVIITAFSGLWRTCGVGAWTSCLVSECNRCMGLAASSNI